MSNHTIDEICSILGISKGTWNLHIQDGVIIKKPQGGYVLGEVASQVIRNQRKSIRSANAINTNLKRKLDKVEALNAQYKGISPDSGTPEKRLTPKEKIDLELSKQKLIKMKHENKVRAKAVMPIDNVFDFVTTISNEFAASLDPISGKIKQMIPDMTAKVYDDMLKLFAQSRNNLARHIEGQTTNELVELFNPDNEELDDLDAD